MLSLAECVPCLQAHEEVRFLLYRLDFTEFYSKKAAPADDVSDDGMMLLD